MLTLCKELPPVVEKSGAALGFIRCSPGIPTPYHEQFEQNVRLLSGRLSRLGNRLNGEADFWKAIHAQGGNAEALKARLLLHHTSGLSTANTAASILKTIAELMTAFDKAEGTIENI